MSDYCGRAKLEDWLSEEVFNNQVLPERAVKQFEQWRERVEQNIEQWMETDDGDGNNTSWRGWGRGFNAIPDSDKLEFDVAIRVAEQAIRSQASVACNFCGAPKDDVFFLVESEATKARICDECVSMARDLVGQQRIIKANRDQRNG